MQPYQSNYQPLIIINDQYIDDNLPDRFKHIILIMRTAEQLSLLVTTMLVALLSIGCRAGPITLSCPNGAILSNYQTFQPNVNYLMSFYFNSTIPASSIVQVQFPSDYSISNSTLSGCLFATSNISSYSTASCYAAYDAASNTYSIYMTNIYPSLANSQTYLSLQFNITNPWAATSQTVTAFISSIASGSTIITYIPSVMNSCSYTSASAVTGASSTHTVSFTPSVQILANTYLQITVPAFLTSVTNLAVANTLTCTGVSNSDAPTLSCSNQVNTYVEVFNISGFVTSTKTLASPIVMNIGLIRNFWSLSAYTPITYQLLLNGLITQNCTGISLTETTLNIPTSVTTILASNTNISTIYTARTLQFYVKNPYLMSSGQFQIVSSAGVSISYILGTGTIVAQNSTSLTLSGVTTSDYTGPTSKISIISGFTIITPPSSRPFTFTYTTYNVSGGISYGIESTTVTIHCSTGTISTASLTANSYAVNAVTKYVISFNTANGLIAGSYIGITFPAYTAITLASTCLCSNGVVGCTVSSTSFANLTVSGAVVAGTTLTITFNSVTNPNQVMTTASFTIYTYYDSGLDSIVDTLTSGLTLTSIPNQIVSMTVTPASMITYALTSYTIDCTLADPIPTGGNIAITFPTAVTFGSLSLTSTSFTNTTCTLTILSNLVTISSCFTSSVTNLTITLVFANIYNPPSFQTTNSFLMYTYGALGEVDYLTSGVTLTMTIPATSSAFTVTPLSQTVHSTTQYTLSITTTVPHTTGNYFTLSIPSSMAFSGPVCSPVSGIASITCLLSNSTSLVVTFGSTPTASTIVIAVTSIRNYDISSTAVSFQLFFFSTNSYIMQTTPVQSVTYNSDIITLTTVNNNDQIALYQNSNITLTVTSPFAIDSSFNSSSTDVDITPPTNFTLSSNTTCSSSVGACIINGSIIMINGAGLSLNSATFTITDILLPFITTSSTSFAISFRYGTLPIATVNSGITISPYCTSPCERCIGNKTVCASCLPNPNTAIYLYTVNSSCLNSCPNGYYANVSLTCCACISPCSYCLDSVNCTKCVNNTWLYGYSCLAICPATYYNDTSGVCLSCQSPCGNCTTISNCSSCIVNFYTNFSCVNASSCPNGTYGNTSSRTCAVCTSPCNNCVDSSLNCTSCLLSLLYYNNTCLASCPNGMYNSSFICVSCIAPCGNCINSTYCLSCSSLFLSVGGQCVNASSCPNGTYGNTTTLTCAACTSPCITCIDSTLNCTSCISTLLYYNNTCQSSCPNTLYNSSFTCVSCIAPCGNCSNSTYCLSCTSLFLSVSGQCVNASNCPNGTYGDISTLTCAACTSPCVTCFDSTLNCTSCVTSKIYYNTTCLSSCPDTMYNSSNTCVSCIAPCGNCTSSTYCLSCTSLYLATGGQCVNASNCPTGTYPNSNNSICTTCTTGCTSCSTFSNCSGCTSFFFFYNYQCLISCPNNTYQSGSSCVACSSTCLTCLSSSSQCTGCNSPSLLYSSTCVSSCPNGTYPSASSCISCQSTCLACVDGSSCSSCSNNYFLSGNQCLANCPSGTYQNYNPNNCSSCSLSCYTCSYTSTNCTSCISSLLLYANTCLPSCPTNFFNVSGECKTCSNCNNCSSAVLCQVCLSGFFMLNGVCYGACPSTSIPDLTSYSCTVCDSNCLTCSTSLTSCNSCKGGLYLLNSVCVYSCPSGYKSDPVSGTCLKSLLGSIVYFPTLITFLIWVLIVAYSKYRFAFTEVITCLCGGLSIIMLISWIILIAISSSSSETPTVISVILGLGLQAVFTNVAIGVGFNIWLRKVFLKDNGFIQWVEHTDYNIYSYRIIGSLSFVCFPVFRLLYSRLYGRKNFSCFFAEGAQFLSISSTVSMICLLLTIAPMLFVCGYVIYLESTYSQTLLSAIDCLILTIIQLLLLILDIAGKDSTYFDSMIQDQPYLKHFRYEEVQNSFSSMRSAGETPDRVRNGKERQHRTEIGGREEQQFFRKNINFIDNLNKFGHLNAALSESVPEERRVKTLPNDLQKYPQLQQNEDDIIVINDDLFFQNEERQRQKQEEERLREEQERLREEQQRKKRELLQRQEEEIMRRKKLLEQDTDEQEHIQFPDIVAIDKLQNKGQKKSPTSILNHFKKVDDKAIGEKAKKKLEEVAKKNGLNAEFMTETFGIEKHHNPELLASIIDIHNHVNRDAVKQLFSDTSNPQILQELFAKNSTLNAERLRGLMNDSTSSEIISALFDKQTGIIAPELAKLLLQNNSKYSSEFVRELLTSQNIIPAEKLRELLRDNPDKASREATLQALKKIGGDQFQNKQILQNLLGQDSPLQATNFLRVTKDLPKQVIQRLFGSKSQTNNIIIQKILNNKKINLKNMSTILEDPELLEELARVFSNGSEAVEQNLINLFMNGQELNPELLRELITNPVLMERLLQRPVDPAFLGAIIGKQAKTDMTLLQNAVERMSEDQLAEVFEFNPQKNINVQKIAQLFEENHHTDPQLIADLLTPEVLASVYSKSSTVKAQMLNKLVQKGKSIDPESIIKIYGEDRPNYEVDKKYNITDNNFNLNKEEILGEMDSIPKGNGNGMSRTAGGMMGFLSPIHVGLHGKKAMKGRQRLGNSNIDDISDEGVTVYNQDEEEEDDEEQKSEEQMKGKKSKRKLRKKPLEDIRLPSEKIYLQRLEAPHELDKNKNVRRKKKKVNNKQLDAMDEDNEVYDLDF